MPCPCVFDNGTNFVGAGQLIKKQRQEFLKQLKGLVISTNSFQNLTWHFIPSGSPHMGGLWEAGVKSFKSHIKKLANLKYTFEELATLLARIEECLNSRPLSPSSENPQDLNPLTPGRFLIGSPLLSLAEPDLSNENKKWLKIQHHQFCKRWEDEYLKELHNRYKWKNPKRPVEVNDIVVIKPDNLPSNEWLLGRVIKTHPGSEGLPRVVVLWTSTGTLHTYIIGHYNPSVRIIDLVSHVSHVTYVVCVNFIHKWRDLQFKVPNDRFFEKLFMAILFTLRVFARNLLRGNRRRNTFRISF